MYAERGKAAGHDNITAEMLQNMGENWLEMLAGLFNKIWEEERIPKYLEVGILILLLRKGDISNCSDYKGITLLSVVLKVYERIMEKRVREILDKQLEESQSVFRKGMNCQEYIKTFFGKNTCT